MDKILYLIGGKKSGSDKTAVVDIPQFFKTMILAMLTLLSGAFAAGQYFGSAKDLPNRVDTLEKKNSVQEERLGSIMNQLDSISKDIREVRAAVMRR